MVMVTVKVVVMVMVMIKTRSQPWNKTRQTKPTENSKTNGHRRAFGRTIHRTDELTD